MKNKLKVVKIGGKLIDEAPRLEKFLSAFASMDGYKILVHGGGSMASRISLKLGIEPQLLDGRRITSSKDIEIVTMVYAGWINKNIVAKLQQQSCNALGLSGADANIIMAHKRPVNEMDYGFVGDIDKVDSKFIMGLMQKGITPVLSAITHDGKGNLLNTNSDTVAAEVAIAMSDAFDTELMYCFEKQGVLENSEDALSVIPVLDYFSYKVGAEEGFIHHGMIPKLHTGFDALKRKVSGVMIGNENILNENIDVFTRLKL